MVSVEHRVQVHRHLLIALLLDQLVPEKMVLTTSNECTKSFVVPFP